MSWGAEGGPRQACLVAKLAGWTGYAQRLALILSDEEGKSGVARREEGRKEVEGERGGVRREEGRKEGEGERGGVREKRPGR